MTVTLIAEAGPVPFAPTVPRHPDRSGLSRADTSPLPVRLRRPPASEPPYDPAFAGMATPARRTAPSDGLRTAHSPANGDAPIPRQGRNGCRWRRCRSDRCRSGGRRAAGGRERTALCPDLPRGPQRLPPCQSLAHSRRTGRVQHGDQPVEPAAQRSRSLYAGTRSSNGGDGSASQSSRGPIDRDPTQRENGDRHVLADGGRGCPILRARVNGSSQCTRCGSAISAVAHAPERAPRWGRRGRGRAVLRGIEPRDGAATRTPRRPVDLRRRPGHLVQVI